MARSYLGRPPIEHRRAAGQETLTALAGDTLVLSFRVKVGIRAELVAYRQAWDPAIDYTAASGGVYHELRVNGVYVRDYQFSTLQIAPPEAATYYLPVPIPVEQNSLIEVWMKNTHATLSGAGYANLDIYYYDPRED